MLIIFVYLFQTNTKYILVLLLIKQLIRNMLNNITLILLLDGVIIILFISISKMIE